MLCPCCVIPILLFIWCRFLQPFLLKIWKPWGKVEDKSTEEASETLDSTKKPFCPCPSGCQSSEAPYPVEAAQAEEIKKTS